jgi:hypothetical protein
LQLYSQNRNIDPWAWRDKIFYFPLTDIWSWWLLTTNSIFHADTKKLKQYSFNNKCFDLSCYIFYIIEPIWWSRCFSYVALDKVRLVQFVFRHCCHVNWNRTCIHSSNSRRGWRSASRVTGLGEFSPIGRLFTLGLFLEIAKVAQVIGILFSTVQVVY